MRSDSRAGGEVHARTRVWLPRLLIFFLLALAVSVPAVAAAASGSARATRVSRAARAARSAPRSPFVGRGMWIWYVSDSNGGDLASIIATAHAYGISTLMIKAGDGWNAWSQFNSQLVASLHAAGLSVCAWQYVYGDNPIYEAEVGAAAAHAGADCLLIDAESEYEGKYIQAQEYMQKLRQLVGASFPVGLASFPYVDYHPAFPYSVFLQAGGAQYNVPQMYWPDIETSVSQVYSHTFDFNGVYERPTEPLGEVAGNPPASQVLQFREMSRPYRATLVSWWDWQDSSLGDWRAIAAPMGSLGSFVPTYTPPVLTVASAGGIWAGDLVVWAQEHLAEAGEKVQIDGDFGPKTRAAVEQFQAAHRLPVTGMIDRWTWAALLRYPRPHVVWTTQHGITTAVAARAGSASSLRLPVPWSAHLPARGYEIPRDLGAGRPGRPH